MEESSITPPMASEESDIDVVSLLKRMQQQLLSLEKKVDQLISESQDRQPRERPPQERQFRNKTYSKSFRTFEHPQRHGRREHGSKERESVPGHFYEHRPHDKSRSSKAGKKPFSFRRKDRE